MRNGKIQPIIDKEVSVFTFRAVQPTTPLLTQDVSQQGTPAGTQTGTQYATRR